MTDRFWSKVEKSDGCWNWTAGQDNSGYGWYLRDDRVSDRAHRVSWRMRFGEIGGADLCVCHHCDNRLCVNPDHLFLGTRRDNNLDMVKKGRGVYPGGKRVYSDGFVFAVRVLVGQGMRQVEVARRMGTRQSSISAFYNRTQRGSLEVRGSAF